MPRIPIFTAEASSPRPRTPSYIPGGDYSAQQGVAQQIGRSGDVFTEIGNNIQNQSDILDLEEKKGKADVGINALRLALPERLITQKVAAGEDPNFSTDEYMVALEAGSKELLKQLQSQTQSNRVRIGLEAHISDRLKTDLIQAQNDGHKLELQQNVAKFNNYEETQSIAAASAVSPEKQQELISAYNKNVDWMQTFKMFDPVQAQKRKTDFQQKVVLESASILSNSVAGREQLYDNLEKHVYDKVDQDKLGRIIYNAQQRDLRAESVGRTKENVEKKAREDRELTVSTLVFQREYSRASEVLEGMAERRELSPDVVQKWRKEIINPSVERASDRDIAARIGMDVLSTRPKTTMAEIDDLVDQHTKGGKGLNLVQGMQFKADLRATLKGLEEKPALMREHNQAEQMLKADFGIPTDLVGMALHENPNYFMYSQFLRRLTTESSAFRGNKPPLDVYNAMKPDIDKARGAQTLSPQQLESLYPGWRDLERARDATLINQKTFETEKARREIKEGKAPSVDLPKLAPPETSTKRKSSSYPQ